MAFFQPANVVFIVPVAPHVLEYLINYLHDVGVLHAGVRFCTTGNEVWCVLDILPVLLFPNVFAIFISQQQCPSVFFSDVNLLINDKIGPFRGPAVVPDLAVIYC